MHSITKFVETIKFVPHCELKVKTILLNNESEIFNFATDADVGLFSSSSIPLPSTTCMNHNIQSCIYSF